jgi:hypothetical protein
VSSIKKRLRYAEKFYICSHFFNLHLQSGINIKSLESVWLNLSIYNMLKAQLHRHRRLGAQPIYWGPSNHFDNAVQQNLSNPRDIITELLPLIPQYLAALGAGTSQLPNPSPPCVPIAVKSSLVASCGIPTHIQKTYDTIGRLKHYFYLSTSNTTQILT